MTALHWGVIKTVVILVTWVFILTAVFGRRDDNWTARVAVFLTIVTAIVFWNFVWLFVLVSVPLSVAVALHKEKDGRTGTINRLGTSKEGTFSSTQSSEYKYTPNFEFAPLILNHGTPSLEAAIDILKNNRWKAFSMYPSGIWMGDFETAATHAGHKGAVVEVQNDIPASLTINYPDIAKDPKYSSYINQYPGDPRDAESMFVIEIMGKRLIRQLDAFIAPTPVTKQNEFYRVDGITPIRVLDRHGDKINV